MKLNLKRPLAIFDLETTGTNVGSDRIVEIAIVKLMPDGQIISKPDKRGKENRWMINPEMPIPRESSMVHGIWDEDVKAAPTFGAIADKLFKFIHDCDLAGFNSNNFDIPILAEEFLRVGIDFSVEGRNLIDVQNLFHLMEQRTLRAGYKFYCGKDLEDAHEALPDTLATLEILEEMVTRYEGKEVSSTSGVKLPDFTNDAEVLHVLSERQRRLDFAGRIIRDEENRPIFNFGKYKGETVSAVFSRDPSYYSWMMNGDFPRYTKKILSDLKKGTLS
jgi:DNA polymerase III subunit epsilon